MSPESNFFVVDKCGAVAAHPHEPKGKSLMRTHATTSGSMLDTNSIFITNTCNKHHLCTNRLEASC